jgi:hypothetical protein
MYFFKLSFFEKERKNSKIWIVGGGGTENRLNIIIDPFNGRVD